MATRFLVLLGLLAAAASLAAGECESDYFPCKDGSKCVIGGNRCDGGSECDDGSDEEGCDALPTVALPVNASVTARVQFAEDHSSIELHLLGSPNCSKVWLWGEGDDGTLRYMAVRGCDGCSWRCGKPVKEHWRGRRFFRPGEVVLEVQHRPGQLAVWRQGRPDDVAEVPVEADYGTLRVRPFNWATDMPVQFTGASRGTAQQGRPPAQRVNLRPSP
ncbi:low-density lipoprotein receptor-related protein 1-like [Thrips palmi]|uniref:Low-density lipoprotein receptor-related protein 1-like n=1 Tax=Thrips palmi TaxID=161013 RepID=A0A6P9A560_THRPL|nr:low-density lipoprotein receptor-related protein 1-like [Thrips palmi]